jgi:hypothetical protein
MSAAGDRLRAERERFERELRLSEATRDAAVGADDSAHFLADSPRTDDDAVWDLPGEEASTGASAGNAGPVMPTTPYREAMRAARAVDAAPAAPPSPKLESPTSDMTASIREALDAAERGLRASVIATDQMERLAASRGTRAASSRRGETATPRDAAALLAAGDEDPEAQAYLKGVLRMIYGGGDDDEDEEEDDDDEDAPARALRAAVARARDGLSTHLMGDDSAREAVVARRAHTRASAAPAAKAPPSGSRADAAVPGVDSEPFAFRTDAASATAVDFRYEVFGATAQATVTRTTAMASAPPPTTTTETDAPAASSPAAASPGGLPPTPTAVKARAASSGSPEAAAMFDEFHRLERGLAEYVDGSPEPGSSPEEKPRAEPPAKRPAARSTSPYRPATADDVVAVAGGSTHTAAVRSAATTANAPPPPRVDAARKAASKQNSPNSASSGASSPSSTIDPVAREALDAMAPRDRADNPAVPDVAAPWSAALDAQTEAEAARKREARRKVEELLGGAFDYEEIRSVARAATAEAEKDHSSFVAADATTLGSSVPTTPPRVAPNGTARPRVARAVEADEETEKDFFADVREAAAFGAGSSFAADPASVVADADASIEAFRAAMRAEVATRIVASASGVSEEVTEMTRARRAATQALRKSVAGATRSRADARSARDAARKRATPPPRGAWRPPPEPPASLRPREASAARASIEARAEADFAAGRSRSAPARERPGASQDGTVASFAARSSEAPAVLSARGASAREAARRRGARAANAAKAREEAEKKREFELLKAERAAEAKRAAAEKKRVEVAFGRRASKADGNGARSDGDNENLDRSERKRRAPPARPRVTEVKPFNLSTGNHTRNKEELLAERENRRDPDVWEPSPAKSLGRLESEAGDEIERFAPATPPDASGRRRRGDDAEKEGESSEKRRTSPRLDAARRARDELKRRSRAASRQTRVIHAASEAAAPAIAAAEEARRDAEAAAAAAARAAAAASAAEALMMAEARRLRERRKELYSRGKDAEFAPARAASLEMDDAPLMASYSSLPDTSLAAARQAAEDFGRDVSGSEIDAAWHRSSETPEKPPLRVSASLASPSPVKPPKLPVAGGPREPVQYDPSRRPGKDARAASDGGAPAPAPAEPERRPAVEPFAFAAEDDGVTTPPSPRSPAVSWTMGALDLPGARLPEPPREESERTDDARAEAEPADAAASAASEKPKREVPAVLRRAAEARAVLAAAAVGPETGVGETSTDTFEGEKPVKASGRRLLFRGDDLAYAPPAEVSAVSKISKTAPATSRSADGVESDGDVTDYGSIDGESDASDGDLTAAAAAAVAAQLARADGEE